MKRLFTNQIARLLWLLLMFVLVTGIVSAQNQNLLTNPGFEQPFTTVAGSPPRQVAQGWSPWNVGGGQSASENVQPEYYPASDVTDGLGVPRIRNGSDAQQYHSFFATHDGGLYQSVSGVTKGAQLRFGAYVYVWSSTFDDPNKSEDPGGIVVQVGIDPTGGTDGSSANIVWSAPSIQYDAYNEYAVTASASNSTVTVWIRSTVTTPVKNSNIYVDDASLIVSTGTGTSPTNTTVPPTATATKTLVPPTNTIVPATATSTSTTVSQPASATPDQAQPTATQTNTAIPSVPTNTVVPTSTTAPALPTATQETTIPTQENPTATPNGGVDNVQFPGRLVHIVRSGDTVGNLATLYGSDVDAIIAANNLPESALIKVGQGLVIPVRLLSPATSTPTPTPIAPVATATTQVDVPAPVPGNVYIIQPGDTLSRIAARFNTTTATLAQLNGITNPNTIYYGQRLIIPVAGQDTGISVPQPPAPAPTNPPPAAEPVTYIVQRGDTLFKIAVRFNVTVAALAQANGIRNTNLVYTGQRLVIPS
ncbi:MAG: LysM peptidoglycan-binding domain-containing protein [Anaerolineaceae bacterium]|nr:LysM peptidoglycan-binding domain-containing protein [Anaerolineaceae bacterium]